MFEFIGPQWLSIMWLLIAVVLGVIEAASAQLVSIWFAVGAAVTIVPAVMGATWQIQLVTFVAVSIALLICTRPLTKKILHVKKSRTNADSVVGQIGVVIYPIDNAKEQGRVLVSGLDWSARSADGEIIEAEEKVVVRQIDGVKLIVERLI